MTLEIGFHYVTNRRTCAKPDLGWAMQQTPTMLSQGSIEPVAAGASRKALPGGRSGLAHVRRLRGTFLVADQGGGRKEPQRIQFDTDAGSLRHEH